MTEWITDRLPTEEDADCRNDVWDNRGLLCAWYRIEQGEPWMRSNRPKAYEKPRRYELRPRIDGWGVFDPVTDQYFADNIHSREAAERIAAIYEEVRP